jgi:hypothetical protein
MKRLKSIIHELQIKMMIRPNHEITDERGRIKTGVMREWGRAHQVLLVD